MPVTRRAEVAARDSHYAAGLLTCEFAQINLSPASFWNPPVRISRALGLRSPSKPGFFLFVRNSCSLAAAPQS